MNDQEDLDTCEYEDEEDEDIPAQEAKPASPLGQWIIRGVFLLVANILQFLSGDTASNTPLERVKLALKDEPDCSDRRLGRLTNLAPATAKKYRSMAERDRLQAM